MPSLEITINVPLSADEQRTFLAKASKTVAEIVGKPEAVRLPSLRSLVALNIDDVRRRRTWWPV